MKQKITIRLAGKTYPLTIERGHEELYRLAERRLSDMITATEQKNLRNFVAQDNIAIAAFNLAVQLIDHQRKGAVSGKEIEHILRLDDELGQYLNEVDKLE